MATAASARIRLGKGGDDVEQDQQDTLGDTTGESGHGAQPDAHHHGQRDRCEGDGGCDLGAVDQAAEQVAPDLIGAEPMRGRRTGEAVEDVERLWVVGRDERGGDGAEQDEAHQEDADAAGPGAQDGAHRGKRAVRRRGVDRGIGQVGRQIGHHEEQNDDEDRALQHRVIARVDRIQHQASDAGAGEHDLDQDGAAEQPADSEAEHGDCGDNGVFQRVFADDQPLREAEAHPGADIRGGEGLKHGRAGEPGDVADPPGG